MRGKDCRKKDTMKRTTMAGNKRESDPETKPVSMFGLLGAWARLCLFDWVCTSTEWVSPIDTNNSMDLEFGGEDHHRGHGLVMAMPSGTW